ncbi:MAG: hypothetical protein ACJ74O_03480 [Frankiaceae bacterium]
MSAPPGLRTQLARLVDEPPMPPDRLAGVYRRARAMRRRRAATLVSSVAVAVAAVVLAGTGLPGGSGHLAGTTTVFSPTTLPTGILLADQKGRVVRLDGLRATTTTAVSGLRIQTGNHLQAAIGTGSDGRSIIAVDTTGDILAIDPGDPAHPRVLLAHKRAAGQPAWYDVPGLGRRDAVRPYLARGGELWLWAWRRGDQQPDGIRHSQLVAVDIQGRPVGRPLEMPSIDWVIAIGRKGAYVAASSGPKQLSLQRVDSHGRLHPLGTAAMTGPDQGSYGRALLDPSADCSGAGTAGGASTGDCAYQLVDADSGKLTALAGRPRTGELAPDAQSFSPDGRYVAVALLAALPLQGDQPSRGWAVADTRTGQMTVVGASVHRVPSGAVADTAIWSGDRLIWTSPSAGGRGTIVGSYLPVTGRSATTTVAHKGLRAVGAAG